MNADPVVCPAPITPTPGFQILHPKGSTSANLGFAEYVPEDYADKTRWPLIVFFNGQGQMGSGSASDIAKLTYNGLTQDIQSDRWDPEHRFIVLSPQMDWEDFNASVVQDFIDFAKANYKVDPQRIYLTALSQGGDPLYAYLSGENGGDAAAAVAISAEAANANQDLQNNPSLQECAYKHVPLWLFHGSADTTVSPDNSRGVFAKLSACMPAGAIAPRYTEYTGVDHDAWSQTYNLSGMDAPVQAGTQVYDISIYDWFLQHSKP
jgi:predicted peptidase